MYSAELYGEEYRDTELYLKGMLEVRDRINLVSTVVARRTTTGREDFDVEHVFVQFRKVLELIAFASLTANRAKYCAAHARFAEYWKAKAQINPRLLPHAHRVPSATGERCQILPCGHGWISHQR